MSYVPPASLLHGLSVEKASLYGMPHIGASYTAGDVNAYRKDDRATCPVCGRFATNVHHHPAKGACPYFTLQTDWGLFVLKPALIAMCGSGTTGCHGDVHQRKVEIVWEWDDDGSAEAWWSGHLLAHGYAPHDPRLYDLGRYRITAGGKSIVVRGGSARRVA